MVRFPKLASLLFFVGGSSADDIDINIHWTLRDVKNKEKRWLVSRLRILAALQDNGRSKANFGEETKLLF